MACCLCVPDCIEERIRRGGNGYFAAQNAARGDFMPIDRPQWNRRRDEIERRSE